jgi:type IV pilus assembly protein PilA
MVLALFVFPAYSNYIKRAKVSEGINLASTAKIAVNHHATDNIPLTSVWTPPTPTDAVMDMGIHLTDTTGISLSSHGQPANMPPRHSGEIVIDFSTNIAPAAHNELILSPRQADPTRFSSNGHELPLDLTHHLHNQPITWECNSANPPAINRGTRGNLNAKLAPANCRS